MDSSYFFCCWLKNLWVVFDWEEIYVMGGERGVMLGVWEVCYCVGYVVGDVVWVVGGVWEVF